MKTESVRGLGVVLFSLLIAELALILLSWILSAAGVEGVRSLLSGEGVRWFVGDFARMVASPLLAWLLLSMMAVGAFLRSGLTSLWHEDRSRILSYRDRTAFRVSLVLLVAYVAAILLLTVVPHAVLLSASGSLFPSPFSRSIIPIVAFGLTLVSITFGMMSGRMQSLSDVLEVLSYGIRRYAPLLVLYVFCIMLYQSLRFVFS
ncbi:MAG: AbgT family transporter [Prevotella sp.]|jgi:aminobenzoyl-glutamate transport protein|nr:AbgT family transporter [Prevotella sp.]